MADVTASLLHTTEVATLGRHLTRLGAYILGDTEFAPHGGRFVAGWRFDIQLDDGSVWHLDVLVGPDFPYAPPRLAIANAPPPPAWAHIEENGVICLLEESDTTSIERVTDVVDNLLHQAVVLLEASVAGTNVADFQSEFVSYWRRAVTEERPEVVSLLRPVGHHREVAVWRGTSQHYIGETEEALTLWLANAGVKPRPQGGYNLGRALLLWSPTVLTPSAYPSSAGDLLKFFKDDSKALALLARLAQAGELATDILLGMRTSRGIGFGAVRPLPPPLLGARGRRVSPITKGFRPGKVPAKVALQRALTPAAAIKRVDVIRADHDLIHGRDHDVRQDTLRGKVIAYIGCGSLGSVVASQLARSGAGEHVFIDGQYLSYENISRHELGAGYIGQNKAKGMAQKLSKDLPHLRFEAFERSFQMGDADVLMRLGHVDLVVATTGNWGVDAMLNQLVLDKRLPPVLFGWLEPEAVAAQAVLIDGSQGCLHCGFTPLGAPELTVSDWKGGGSRDNPACGGTFSPYGPLELTSGATLIAEAALSALFGKTAGEDHQIWVGDTRQLAAKGGTISDSWLTAVGDPGRGRFTVSRDWSHVADCPVCGTLRAAAQ